MADPLANLDIRQQKYVENRAAGMNKYRAGLAAGYSTHMARAATAKIERPEVREALKKLLRQFVSAHKLAQRIAEGLDAMETKIVTYKGAITDTIDLVNYTERREYIKLILEYGYSVTDGDHAPGQTTNESKVVIEYIGTPAEATAETVRTPSCRRMQSG